MSIDDEFLLRRSPIVENLYRSTNIKATGVATISACDFNWDVSRTQRLASDEPVVITDRDRPSHILLSIEYYERLAGGRQSIVDLLKQVDTMGIDCEVERLHDLPTVPEL